MAKSGVRGALATIFMATVFAVGSVFASSAGAADGDLDPSFSGDGKQTTDFGDSGDSAKDVAVQSDGKIVAVGNAEFSGETSTGNDFAIARYNADGSLDTTFEGDGKVTTNFRPDGNAPSRGASDRAFAVVMQTVGGEEKILAVGTSDDGLQDTALARYDEDGSLDETFGDGGTLIVELNDTSLANDVAIDGDGNIVTAGTVNTGTSNPNFSILRFDADGELDTSFGTGGVVETDIGGGEDEGNGLALTPGGGIVVAGMSRDSEGDDFALVKYTSTGDLDAAFGPGGKVLTDFTGGSDAATSVALAEGGDLVAAGLAGNDVECDPDCVSEDFSDFGLARYTAAGTLVPTFGTDGKVTTDFNDAYDEARDVKIQADGKIVAAGLAPNPVVCSPDCPPGSDFFDFGVARYMPDGGLDDTFGEDGKVRTSIFESSEDTESGDEAHALAIQENGGIIAAGESFRRPPSDPEEYDFAIVRYGDAAPTSSCAGRPATIVGQSGGGAIVGTPGSDVIVGTPDADDIRGRGGDDVICGRGDDDRILGNSGKDRLYGQGGGDLLVGGKGDDRANGGAGDDRIEGRAGKDALVGGAGGDLLLGHGGNDVLNARDGVRGNDLANGGPGNDRCAANPRDQKINCER